MSSSGQPSLSIYHAFGHRIETSGGALFFAEQGLLYPTGRHIVLNELQKRIQRFALSTLGSAMEGITALALCPNRRYVAFAQKGERPSVAIFDVFTLKRREDLVVSEGGQAKEFVSLAFSPDGKCLIAQSGAPDWNLYCWAWEKAKPLASIRSGNLPSGNQQQNQAQLTANPANVIQSSSQQPTSNICNVQYSPADCSLVSVLGPTTFRLFRLGEGIFRPVPVPPATQKQLGSNAFLCHTWVSGERIVVGTASGELLLFELAEYRATIPQPTTVQNESPGVAQQPPQSQPAQQPQSQQKLPAITSLVSVAKGFVCGDSSGAVHYYEKSEDAAYFRKKASMNLASMPGATGSSVLQLAANPSEALLAAVLETNELRVLDFSAASTRIAQNLMLESPLARSCHAQQVTGMDVCLRKPLFVTVSTDRSMRVFSYKHNNVILAKTFPEEAYSVAIHPMGSQVLIGFVDKLRFANLLLDDVQVFAELEVKGCREVRFNSGGNLFAAACGNNISIYNTYTLEVVSTFKGHAQRVRSLCFSADDSCLVSAGVDGGVICWDMHKFRRITENGVMMRAVQFTGIACNSDATVLYASGSDKALREIVGGQVKQEISGDVTITCLAVSVSGQHPLLVSGTSLGSVRLYRQPLSSEGSGAVISEIFLHSGPVSRLRFSRDGNVLLSSGEDGSVFSLDVRDPSGKVRVLQELDYDDEVLVSRSSLEERDIAVSEARSKLAEVERENEAQVQLKEISHTQKLHEMADKHAREIDGWKGKHASVVSAKEASEKAANAEAAKMKEQTIARISELEQRHQERLSNETQRCAELSRALDELKVRSSVELQRTREEAAAALAKCEEQWKAKVAAHEQEIARLRQETSSVIRGNEEDKLRAEVDADEEIAARREAMERRLDDEVQGHAATRNSLEAQQKKVRSIQRDLEEQKHANSVLQAQVSKLTDTVHALERDRDLRIAELQEWDNTVREKDRRISELRAQASELEKLKFVLDFKVQEVNSQIAPLHAEIATQKEQARHMNEELSANHAKFQELNFQIASLRSKSTAAAHESATIRRRLAESEAALERHRAEVQRLSEHIQSPAELKAAVKDLLLRVGTQTDSSDDTATDVQAEMARQRDHLERAMESLRNKASKERQAAEKENHRLIRENVALIAEINALRRESKELRTTVREQSSSTMTTTSSASAEAQKMLSVQREELSKLRRRVAELEAAMAARLRPYSRECLPPMPMDGARQGVGIPQDELPSSQQLQQEEADYSRNSTAH